MIDKKLTAKRFFRGEAYYGYGYLLRARGLLKPTDMAWEFRSAFWDGIRKIWRDYTKDNPIAEQAKHDLNLGIGNAKRYFHEDREETNQELRLFFKEAFQACDEYAEKVDKIWKAFIKDMTKKDWSTLASNNHKS